MIKCPSILTSEGAGRNGLARGSRQQDESSLPDVESAIGVTLDLIVADDNVCDNVNDAIVCHHDNRRMVSGQNWRKTPCDSRCLRRDALFIELWLEKAVTVTRGQVRWVARLNLSLVLVFKVS